MTRQVTFSTKIPKGIKHPNEGEKTYFMEKIWNFIYENYPSTSFVKATLDKKYENIPFDFDLPLGTDYPKLHTIRKGFRNKVGDKIRPMIWAGIPYHKTPEGDWKYQFAPELPIMSIYHFSKRGPGFFVNEKPVSDTELEVIARNDGLSLEDFKAWFSNDFEGQIICWGNVRY